MFASIWSILGWKEEEPVVQYYPPVTIVGVRIPADGSPIHLLPLTTISDSSATDSFLLHVPDLRSFWFSAQAWRLRDIHRIDLLQDSHIPLSHYLRKKDDFRTLVLPPSGFNREQMLHLRQQHLLPQQYFVAQHQHPSCIGAYYVFYSFAVDDLPINRFVPRWIQENNDPHLRHNYFGDVFLVKIKSHEFGQDGRAAYEDIVPQFLDLLVDNAARSTPPVPLL